MSLDAAASAWPHVPFPSFPKTSAESRCESLPHTVSTSSFSLLAATTLPQVCAHCSPFHKGMYSYSLLTINLLGAINFLSCNVQFYGRALRFVFDPQFATSLSA